MRLYDWDLHGSVFFAADDADSRGFENWIFGIASAFIRDIRGKITPLLCLKRDRCVSSNPFSE